MSYYQIWNEVIFIQLNFQSSMGIREQFPLLSQEEPIIIAKELGVKHPTDPKTREPIVVFDN